jgi:hypothetical protein
LVEQLTLNQRVLGSSPSAPTNHLKHLANLRDAIPTNRQRLIPTNWLICARTKRKLGHHRALELLACPQEGCTEAVMLAHGFTLDQMVELVRAGLATATPQRVTAGRHKMEVATLRITNAGRKALSRG